MYVCGYVYHSVNVMLGAVQNFGELDYVRFLTDRNTGASRGLAYVKFFRSYHAALALEGCNSRKLLLHRKHITA